jgi:hypothetical protein
LKKWTDAHGGFDPNALDEILGLRARGLRSVAILPLGYRADEGDWLVNLKKVRRPASSSSPKSEARSGTKKAGPVVSLFCGEAQRGGRCIRHATHGCEHKGQCGQHHQRDATGGKQLRQRDVFISSR